MRPIAHYVALPVDTKPVWFFRDVTRALEAHERGDFYESALLADALGRLPRVAGPLETRAAALVAKGCGTSFRIEPPKGYEDDAQAKELVEIFEEFWWDAIPDWVVKSIIRDVTMMGVAYGRRAWAEKDGEWHVTLEPWHLQHLMWDESIGRYRVNTTTGPVVIEPDDPNWYVYEPNGPRSWMQGAIRAISDLATYRNNTLRDWARYCERHGMPILAIEEPSGASKDDREIFFKKVANMGSDATIRLPRQNKDSGYDLKYVEPKNGEAWRTFQAFLDALSNEFVIRIKGNNLTTEVKGGSFAAATVHGQVDLMILTSDAQVGTFFRKVVIVPWCEFNIDKVDIKKCPWPVYDTSPPEDMQARALTWKAFGEAAGFLDGEPCYFDVEKAMQEFKIPRLSDEQIKKRKAEDEAKAAELAEQMAQQGPPGGGATPPGRAGEGGEGGGKAKAGALGAGRAAKAPRWARAGQSYVDRQGDRGAPELGLALAHDLDVIMGAVRRAETHEGLRVELEHAFPAMSPAALAAVLEKALILAELAGRLAILGDL